MKRIFATTLILPLITSIFFIMCTRQVPPTTANETPVSTGGVATDSASSATTTISTETANLERIEIHTEKVNGAVHWMPATIRVKAGKDYLLVAKHELEGGFDFHGLFMKDFDVQVQVNRKKAYSRVLSIPKEKTGSFVIGCHFHPAHNPALLIVE